MLKPMPVIFPKPIIKRTTAITIKNQQPAELCLSDIEKTANIRITTADMIQYQPLLR